MTLKRLNGWLRLWIVAAFFWGMLVASFGVLEWPSSSSFSRSAILEKLDTRSVEIIESSKSVYSVTPALPPGARGFSFAGEELVVTATVSEMETLRRNYDEVLHKLLLEKRLSLVTWLLMLWSIPLAIVGAAVFSIRWVYDGFRSP
jgi:hypothetical protein